MMRELSFENFYVHEGNEVAYLAAQKIIEFPGEIFNPFYIYGGSGLGKTHLLRATHIELNKKFATLFFTAEEFERYVEETDKIDTPVIIDDLHMVAAKYQRILCDIIDTFQSRNRQICLSANLPPKDIKNLDTKLLSRLDGGFVCDIQTPRDVVLIDMIKKKSEEAGMILPDNVLAELVQLSGGSMRTIEDMINRLNVYSSLGNLSLDKQSVRSVLREFYPKGIYSPVASLVSELKKDPARVLHNVSEKLNPREQYKEKIYIWEMKGFNTSALTSVLNSDLNILKKEYDDFIRKVERLTDLQKTFSILDTTNFPEEAMQIEMMIFSPSHVEEVERLISKIIKEVERTRPIEFFGTFIIGGSNRNVYTIYHDQIVKSLGERFNPFIVYGKSGTGKTHFLEAINRDLINKSKLVNFIDLVKKDWILKLVSLETFDVLVVDNFHHVMSLTAENRQSVFDLVLKYIKADKAVMLSSGVLSTQLSLAKEEKIVFELGLEVELMPPSSDIVIAYINSKLDPDRAEALVRKGLPKFASFHDLDDYLKSADIETPSELVSLGFPGEEASDSQRAKGIEEGKDGLLSKLSSAALSQFRSVREERYIFPKALNEFLEEGY